MASGFVAGGVSLPVPHVERTPVSGDGMTAESRPGTEGERLGMFALSSCDSLFAGGFGAGDGAAEGCEAPCDGAAACACAAEAVADDACSPLWLGCAG